MTKVIVRRSVAASYAQAHCHRRSRDGPELLEANLESSRIRPVGRTARLQDRGAVKALESGSQHRTVDLVEQPARDMYRAPRVDTHQVPVVGEVMDGAQRDPVGDRRRTARVAIVDDVSGRSSSASRRAHTAQRSR